MQDYFNECSCQEFFECDVIVPSNQEDVSMHEPTVQLLRLFASLKLVTVDELQCSVNRLELWRSLEWDVLDGDEVDLKRVQLLAVEV